MHFEDDDNGGDQDKEIRDIGDSFAELNINGIENDNDTESSINEEYKYIIQILPSVLRNLAESNQDNTLRTFIKLVHKKMDVSFFNPDINLTNLPPNSFQPTPKKFRVSVEYRIPQVSLSPYHFTRSHQRVKAMFS